MIDIETLLPDGYPRIPAIISDLGATLNRVAETLGNASHSVKTESKTIYITLEPPTWSVDDSALQREILRVCMNETLRFSHFSQVFPTAIHPETYFPAAAFVCEFVR